MEKIKQEIFRFTNDEIKDAFVGHIKSTNPESVGPNAVINIRFAMDPTKRGEIQFIDVIVDNKEETDAIYREEGADSA